METRRKPLASYISNLKAGWKHTKEETLSLPNFFHLERSTTLSVNIDEAETILAKLQHWSHSLSQECQELRRLLDGQSLLSTSPLIQGNSEPLVSLDGQNLWVDHWLIPLSTRERTLKLVEAFFAHNTLTLKKRALIACVYNTPDEASERLTLALEGRLIKLMSRTRHFLNGALSSSNWMGRLEWFAYDHKSQTYRLYTMRPSALLSDLAPMKPHPSQSPKFSAALLIET